jgi:K+-transporting ATPase c subunit
LDPNIGRRGAYQVPRATRRGLSEEQVRLVDGEYQGRLLVSGERANVLELNSALDGIQ